MPEGHNRAIASHDPKIAPNMSKIMPAVRDSNLVFRMTEGNSCYRGVKPGMSNAFASALWAGDYMLHMAALGCGGVNLHGGSTKFIRASLGGHLPGELVTKIPMPQRAAASTRPSLGASRRASYPGPFSTA